MHKLDSIYHEHVRDGDRVLLKIDVQGFERQVLEGAVASLSKITGVEMEMSYVSLYGGDSLITEMINYLANSGLTLVRLEPFRLRWLRMDRQLDRLLQGDAMFFRMGDEIKADE